MEARLQDKAWRWRSSLCAWLSLIPVFGFFGFLFMGKRAKRRSFRTAGWVYGALSVFACAAIACGEIMYDLDVLTGAVMPRLVYTLFYQDLPTVSYVLLFILWPVVAVHTFVSLGKYLRFLALEQSLSPAPHALTRIRKWRLRNLWWTVWSYLPVIGMLSTWFCAVKTGNRKLKNYALLSGLAVVAVYAANIGLRYMNYSGIFSNGLRHDICETLLAFLNLMHYFFHLLLTAMLREDYLEVMARRWEGDTHNCLQLSNVKWQRRNCGWQIWTLFPMVNGVGILLGARKGKLRKAAVTGAVICLANIVLFVVPPILEVLWDVAISEPSYSFRMYLYEPLLSLARWILYLLVIWYGCLIRWDVLKGHAGALQGYSSEIEREIDLRRRMAERRPVAPVPSDPEPMVPAATPVPVIREPERLDMPPVPAAPGGKVDINHCTQADLMALPGITVAQAKRALEHRSAQGPFRSLDEFVEVLEVKPHFAVQIFRQATAGEPPASEPAARPDSGAVRRRIDF